MYEGSILDDVDNYFNAKQQQSGTQVALSSRQSSSNSDNLALFYQKLESLGINLTELKPILECQEHLLILSGAGSGKTTALILKILRDLISGDMMTVTTVNSVYGEQAVRVPAKILVSTFLKSGAQELQSALRDWCHKLGITGLDYSNIKFSTIHAEVKNALEQMGLPVSVIEDTNSMVRSIMTKYGVRSVTATSRSVTVDEIADVSGILAYARNRLDEGRYDHPLMQDYRLDKILLDALLIDFKVHRRATGKMDFEDMQETLLEALTLNPNVVNFIGKRYDYIFVDEFQDTSQLQYELLKFYFNQSKRTITVGDSDQCIYGWRGSDNAIIEHRFEEDYHPQVLNLTTNYRCKANILNPVIPSIHRNTSKHKKDLRSYAEGGEVSVVYNGDVNLLVQSMKEDLKNNMRVGVLARVNSDLLVPAIILELDGGIEFGLSKSVSMNNRLSRQIFGSIDLVTKRYTDEFESLFRMFLSPYNRGEADKLCAVLAMNKKLNLYTIPIEDLATSVPFLAPVIKGLRSAKAVGGVEAYLFLLDYMDRNVFVGSSIYSKKAKDLISFVKKIVLEHDKVQGHTIEDLDNLFNHVLPERLNRRIKYANDPHIKLTTVHEAKGKEWDSVYIWNDVSGTFPNSFGNRDLSPAEYEEERRVHYIAWTRAKSRLTVFTDQNNQGDFLKECDLSLVVPISGEPDKHMHKVFRANTTPEIPALDTVLRSYIVNRQSERSVTDDACLNIDLVLSRYTLEQLVELFDQELGLSLDADTGSMYELLDLHFAHHADKIYRPEDMDN